MKLSVFVAATLALLSTPFSAASPQSHHLRVHISSKKASLYQQCEWEDKAVRCDSGLFCVMREKHFGWCLKQKPVQGDQCGGKGASGPWAVACDGSNLKCVLISDQYSQCQTKSNMEKHKMPTGEDASEQKVPLYGRCKYEDGSVGCADGLQCIEDSDFSGHCLRKEAELYDQCGGQDLHGAWKASCPKEAHCRVTDEFYSRCLPGAA